jgi:hypothetical protein
MVALRIIQRLEFNKINFKKYMNNYDFIIVESFYPIKNTGRHGLVHIRPLPNQDPFLTNMFVECSKDLSNNFPVGTKFKIKAKIKLGKGETIHIYSYHGWSYEVLK